MKTFIKKLYNPSTNVYFYSLLLIITPFLLLQNYLQDAIVILSRLSFNLGSIEIPIILTLLFVFVITLFIAFRKQITWVRIIAWLVIIFMWALGQRSTDYYLNTKFYDLQHNWHYIAYGLFAILTYRALKQKKFAPAKIIYLTFVRALMISTFDEAIQIIISSRVFDISDIAKDAWGVLMGIIFIFFIIEQGEIFKTNRKIRQKKIKDYLHNPVSILVLELILVYLLLVFSSILSESKFWFVIILVTAAIFSIIFFIIHKSQHKNYRRAFFVIAIVLIIIQAFSFFGNINKNITHHQKWLTVYKGIPIPYFDVMIHENGTFRLVDKKINFNQADIMFFCNNTSNILLIGYGEEKIGRMGFTQDLESQFMFNPLKKKALQIILLPSTEACKEYNRLKREGKKVLFILHNS